MKLYNTTTKKIEEIKPDESSQINQSVGENTSQPALGLYACGPTVYDYAHLGHMRKYTMDDVLVRTLRHAGFDVKYVRNITDVGHLSSDGDTGEDKLEKGAKKYGESVWDIAKKFTNHFDHSMKLMGNIDPDITATVTDHIPEQLDLVKKLEEKGYTYVIDGDGVYFDTSKFADYGKMARLKLDKQQEGARICKVTGKKNPADFALWKFEREGENRAMAWESPWHKRSFPGWHIECSAIGMKYLGEQFSIHTGGIDHIPVHHTNEIAQTEAATGKKPFVKYWVHHNFLQIEGEKMSKSLGNFFTVDDVVDRGFSPKALRMLYLTSHYRSEQNFTWANLEGTQKSYLKLMKQVVKLQSEVLNNEDIIDTKNIEFNLDKISAEVQNYKDQFFSYMQDDLKTSEALALLWKVLKSGLSAQEKLVLFYEFDKVLGLGISDAKMTVGYFNDKNKNITVDVPSKIIQLLEDRSKARQNKDWQKSDKIRDQIKELGYEVRDVSGEQELKKI